MHVVLFGPPGVGKGTQASMLVSKGFKHLSTGELFRDEVKKNSELGNKITEVLKKGELVDDDTVNKVFSLAIKDISSPIVFDGYPRSPAQFEYFAKLFKPQDIVVIFLNAPDSTLIERIQNRARVENRPDDSIEVIQERLKQYYSYSFPVKELFEKNGYKVYEIDCLDSIENINRRILQCLNF